MEEGSIHGTPSIDLTIPEECTLAYVWIAEFRDGTLLGQFDSTGREVMYREVQNRIHDLLKLHLTSVDGDHRVTVRLTDGMRPICFRRHIRRMNSGKEPHSDGHEVVYALGFQQTIRECNFKGVMYIDKQGNVTLENE